ncbi:MAG: hybrid sensor histidine kinase/response regulator [Planctomycetota bacterium]|nr:hybrid sensor histidine kinase/response regulator [Planctomycetota bacterium]
MSEETGEQDKPGTKIRSLEEKRVLIVEDDPDQGDLLREVLVDRNAFVTVCTDAQSCLMQDLGRFDVVLLDQNLPDSTGIELLERILIKQRLPIIMVTGEDDYEIAVDAIQRGASDYICKVGDYLRVIPLVVQKNLEQFRLREENKRLAGELLNRIREVEQSSRVKDEFLASVSHELRTPLNAIMGLSEALQEEVYGPLTEKQTSSLKTIENSGRRLLNQINDVIDLSRIGTRKIHLERQDINIEQSCKQAINYVQSAVKAKNQSVTFQGDGLFETVYVDPKRFRQILHNLLDNAIKFGPEEASIEVRATTLQEEAMVAISISNDGSFIPPEKREHLFTPFVQLDSGLNRKHEGTGLGLVLVDRFTQMHGGRVQVESSEEKGTCFTIVLPIEPPEEE